MGQRANRIVDILLVEDEAILAMVASEVLQEAGYRVHECPSAEEALAALDDGYAPHLAIIDHGLPGLNGADLARMLQVRLGSIPILIASGDASPASVDFPLLAKPYRDAELVERVASLLSATRGSARVI